MVLRRERLPSFLIMGLVLWYSPLGAGELYRLRIVAPEAVLPGQSFDVTVVADATAYPESDDGVPSLEGFGFSFDIPEPLDLEGMAWGADSEGSVMGSYGWGPTATSHRVGASALFRTFAPNAVCLELLRVQVRAPIGAEWGSSHALAFVTNTDPVFLTSAVPVDPHPRNASIVIALAGSSTDAFPEPTEQELVAAWWTPGSSPMSPGIMAPVGGGGMAGASGGPPTSATFYCDWEVKGPPPDCQKDPITCPPPVSCCSIASLQGAINDAIASGIDTLVRVEPGTYVGQLIIDLSILSAHVIVVAEEGPDTTVIDANGMSPAVDISGISMSTDAQFTFGWHEADEINEQSPFDGGTPASERGWRGFEIRNGGTAGATMNEGAGIVVRDTDVFVEIRGHYIHDNGGPALPIGGANILLERCGDVDVVSNDISSSQATTRGAGITVWQDPYQQVEPKITIAKNYIHDNECTGTSSETQGGGIYATDYDTDICRNFIYENRAVQGCGVYLSFQEDLGGEVFYVEANDIYDNEPFLADAGLMYLGGGVAIAPHPGVSPPADEWHLGFVRNRVYGNGERKDEQRIIADGGGVHIEVDFGSALGPFGILGEGPEGQIFVGNAVYQNHADGRGGGVYFAADADATVADREFRFWTNTLWENLLVNGTEGQGLYVAAFAGEGTECSTNIVHDHLDSGALQEDWYVEDPSPFDLLEYSRTEECSPPSPVDIFPPAPTETSTIEPDLLEILVQLRTYCRQKEISESIDMGEPVLIDPAHPRLGVDFDDQPRVINVIDIGADEYLEEGQFTRGDANDDGVFDISDPVRILDFLFVLGSPLIQCRDAGDANDDGALDISDAVYALAALFIGGSPPPPPPTPPLCGLDPTDDALTCNVYVNCP